MSEEVCRALFAGTHLNRKLAASIAEAMPPAACEVFSVSPESPGPVAPGEKLIRLAISPRDFDAETGELAMAPFEKVFEQGLSVLRDCVTDGDCLEQAHEILPHKDKEPRKEVHGISIAVAHDVRELNEDQKRLFAVYDQVVPRFRHAEKPAIPSHAGIFATVVPVGEPAKGQLPPKQIRKDMAKKLYDLFLAGNLAVPHFRGDLFGDLNTRARNGEFQIADAPPALAAR